MNEAIEEYLENNLTETGVVAKVSFSEIKENLSKYLGVENSKRQQVFSAVDKFFGVKNSVDRINKMGELGLMLAGGTINSIYSGRSINDLDFYIRDASKIEDAKAFIAESFGKQTYESANAITYKRSSGNKKYEVQLITRFTGEPQTILDTFDFTIVQGLFDFQTKSFQFTENFLPDIASRTLRFTSTSYYPICALIRTRKYQDRGYFLPNSTMLAISFAINRLDLKTYKNLKDQLLGIDTMFLKGFLETLDSEQELSDEERTEFINICCTLIDNAVMEQFGASQNSDQETE